MNVSELIQLLEQYPEDSEVHIVTQPGYALEFEVAGCVSQEDIICSDQADEEYERPSTWEGKEQTDNTVFIATKSWVGYGQEAVFKLLEVNP